jgi:hypothetical protein
MRTYFDGSILPAGYIKWSTTDPRYDNNTLMAVYNDYGPGYNATALNDNSITTMLQDAEIQSYNSPVDVFLGVNGEPHNTIWIDQSVLS